MKAVYKDPQHLMVPKDPNLPPEQMLEVDTAQLKAAKDGELLKPIRVRFIEDGPDRTIDPFTKFPKTSTVEGLSAQESILELRRRIAQQEKLPLEDVVLCCSSTSDLPDNVLIANCYVDWMGYGLEDWPPRFISRPRVQGFEIFVDVPASRDTSVWENGRMQSYFDRQIVFDVSHSTTVAELKGLIAKKLGIPASRHKLTAYVRESLGDLGHFIDLDDDKQTMGHYDLERRCVNVKFEKCQFDANGDFVFDDAYWDAEGYHAPPIDSWIPLDSLADRTRPDASKVDPTQPLSIVSDRRQKEVTDKAQAH